MSRVATLIVAIMCSGVLASPSPADLLARAEAAFEAGETLLNSDPQAGRARLDEAVALYRALVDMGSENPAIHRNIGNAFMRRGDLGRAIAAFRRAEALDPRDARVRESLAAARAQVRTEVSTGAGERLGGAVLFWRGFVERELMLGVGLGAWAMTWAAASVRLFTRRGGPAAVVFGVVCVVTLGSLTVEGALARMNPQGVVVADEVMARRGPSDSVYEPAFEQPLRAGVEAAILERRDGWARLRLRSGSEAWVPESAVEEI